MIVGDYMPIKLHMQKQAVGWIRPTGCNLQTCDLYYHCADLHCRTGKPGVRSWFCHSLPLQHRLIIEPPWPSVSSSAWPILKDTEEKAEKSQIMMEYHSFEGAWGALKGFYLEVISFELCLTKIALVLIQEYRFKGEMLKERISSRMVW